MSRSSQTGIPEAAFTSLSQLQRNEAYLSQISAHIALFFSDEDFSVPELEDSQTELLREVYANLSFDLDQLIQTIDLLAAGEVGLEHLQYYRERLSTLHRVFSVVVTLFKRSDIPLVLGDPVSSDDDRDRILSDDQSNLKVAGEQLHKLGVLLHQVDEDQAAEDLQQPDGMRFDESLANLLSVYLSGRKLVYNLNGVFTSDVVEFFSYRNVLEPNDFFIVEREDILYLCHAAYADLKSNLTSVRLKMATGLSVKHMLSEYAHLSRSFGILNYMRKVIIGAIADGVITEDEMVVAEFNNYLAQAEIVLMLDHYRNLKHTSEVVNCLDQGVGIFSGDSQLLTRGNIVPLKHLGQYIWHQFMYPCVDTEGPKLSYQDESDEIKGYADNVFKYNNFLSKHEEYLDRVQTGEESNTFHLADRCLELEALRKEAEELPAFFQDVKDDLAKQSLVMQKRSELNANVEEAFESLEEVIASYGRFSFKTSGVLSLKNLTKQFGRTNLYDFLWFNYLSIQSFIQNYHRCEALLELSIYQTDDYARVFEKASVHYRIVASVVYLALNYMYHERGLSSFGRFDQALQNEYMLSTSTWSDIINGMSSEAVQLTPVPYDERFCIPIKAYLASSAPSVLDALANYHLFEVSKLSYKPVRERLNEILRYPGRFSSDYEKAQHYKEMFIEFVHASDGDLFSDENNWSAGQTRHVTSLAKFTYNELSLIETLSLIIRLSFDGESEELSAALQHCVPKVLFLMSVFMSPIYTHQLGGLVRYVEDPTSSFTVFDDIQKDAQERDARLQELFDSAGNEPQNAGAEFVYHSLVEEINPGLVYWAYLYFFARHAQVLADYSVNYLEVSTEFEVHLNEVTHQVETTEAWYGLNQSYEVVRNQLSDIARSIAIAETQKNPEIHADQLQQKLLQCDWRLVAQDLNERAELLTSLASNAVKMIQFYHDVKDYVADGLPQFAIPKKFLFSVDGQLLVNADGSQRISNYTDAINIVKSWLTVNVMTNAHLLPPSVAHKMIENDLYLPEAEAVELMSMIYPDFARDPSRVNEVDENAIQVLLHTINVLYRRLEVESVDVVAESLLECFDKLLRRMASLDSLHSYDHPLVNLRAFVSQPFFLKLLKINSSEDISMRLIQIGFFEKLNEACHSTNEQAFSENRAIELSHQGRSKSYYAISFNRVDEFLDIQMVLDEKRLTMMSFEDRLVLIQDAFHEGGISAVDESDLRYLLRSMRDLNRRIKQHYRFDVQSATREEIEAFEAAKEFISNIKVEPLARSLLQESDYQPDFFLPNQANGSLLYESSSSDAHTIGTSVGSVASYVPLDKGKDDVELISPRSLLGGPDATFGRSLAPRALVFDQVTPVDDANSSPSPR